MAHGGRVQDALPRRALVDISEVAIAHRQKVPVTQGRAFGLAGRAASVKQPRCIIRLARRARHRVRATQG